MVWPDLGPTRENANIFISFLFELFKRFLLFFYFSQRKWVVKMFWIWILTLFNPDLKILFVERRHTAGKFSFSTSYRNFFFPFPCFSWKMSPFYFLFSGEISGFYRDRETVSTIFSYLPSFYLFFWIFFRSIKIFRYAFKLRL